MQKMAGQALRAVGLLIGIPGLVHIAATPHIPQLIAGSPPAVYAHAVGPTMLNHVLVGILLLPLGYSTWFAVGWCERDRIPATRILIANTAVMFTLPVSNRCFYATNRVLHCTSFPHRCGIGYSHFVSDGRGHIRSDESTGSD